MGGAFQRRRLQAEVMDQPGLDRGEHFAALRGLERINFFSGSVGVIWGEIQKLDNTTERERKVLRVLDIATGAGDLPIGLAKRARREGIALEVGGCDRSEQAIEFARERARRAGVEARFFVADALREGGIGGGLGYDIICSSLFLHHLDEDDGVRLLLRMRNAARRMVLVDDLIRSRPGYWLAWGGTRLLSRSEVVHVDGPRSVEGALTVEEALELARRAGLDNGGRLEARQHWPFRYLMRWERTDLNEK